MYEDEQGEGCGETRSRDGELRGRIYFDTRKETQGGRRRTSAAIPGQMPQSVKRVESEWKSEDALRGVFHGLGEFLDGIDDIL